MINKKGKGFICCWISWMVKSDFLLKFFVLGICLFFLEKVVSGKVSNG